MVTRGKRGQRVVKAKGAKYMVTEADLTLGGGHTVQYIDDDVSKLYTRNLYNFISQCHYNKFNLTRGSSLEFGGQGI